MFHCYNYRQFLEYIQSEEARIHEEIRDIAAQITKKNHKLKWVWLAGPSSAGKTTFTRRLSAELNRQGVKTHPVSLDNYFVDREKIASCYDVCVIHAERCCSQVYSINI